MKKANTKIACCPYCGKLLNYFFLWDCKKSDVGNCNHCGGVYAVKYSKLGYILYALAVGGFAGVWLFYRSKGAKYPEIPVLIFFLALFVLLYFLMPLTIRPKKCIINQRLGGFPNAEAARVMRDGAYLDQPEQPGYGSDPAPEAPQEGRTAPREPHTADETEQGSEAEKEEPNPAALFSQDDFFAKPSAMAFSGAQQTISAEIAEEAYTGRFLK